MDSLVALRELAARTEWASLGTLTNTAFRESDILYDTNTAQYYLFSTASYVAQGAIDLYVAATPETLTAATPIRLAPTGTNVTAGQSGIYPTAHIDPATGIWHLYASVANTSGGATGGALRHFTSTTPTIDNSWALVVQSGFTLNTQLTDVQIRKHPTNGRWYCVGFPGTGANPPLTITWADSPHGMTTISGTGSPVGKGLWRPIIGATWSATNPNVVVDDTSSIFADIGYPTWAAYARPDPNLAFTADGRAWVLFTGYGDAGHVVSGRGIVEVDLSTGRAKGRAVQLLDPAAGTIPGPSPFYSDLSYVAVPGEVERIFGFTHDGLTSAGGATPGAYPLGVLELEGLGYTLVKDALIARLKTIEGMGDESVLGYEPASVHRGPLMYVLFDGYTRSHAPQVTGMTYKLLVRVLVPWQDNEGSELLLDDTVNAIPAAIDADPRFLGLTTINSAEVTDAVGVFVNVGGALCRAHDVTVEVLEKGPYQGGL